jgi:hypothetical protein
MCIVKSLLSMHQLEVVAPMVVRYGPVCKLLRHRMDLVLIHRDIDGYRQSFTTAASGQQLELRSWSVQFATTYMNDTHPMVQ